jgi:hypothetical protein
LQIELDKVCLLAMIGVHADGTKKLVAPADGFRESSEQRWWFRVISNVLAALPKSAHPVERPDESGGNQQAA